MVRAAVFVEIGGIDEIDGEVPETPETSMGRW
jgi:hypothetical protein